MNRYLKNSIASKYSEEAAYMPISNTTFDKMKQYVSVRMQQGVPLLDSDWNEKDDIRRYEMRSFIKWFIGDGVPYGNDGFAIKVLNQEVLYLSWKVLHLSIPV
jgi:hypothetical protein